MEEKTFANRQIVRACRADEQEDDTDVLNTTPAERIAMMWQLTLDAWAFTGEPLDESRLPRHIIHILR